MAFGAIAGGAGAALLGSVIAGGGRRPTSGYSAEQEESLRRMRAALSNLQGLTSPEGKARIEDVFGISQDEQRRRRELISTGASRTTEDVIDAIRAEAGRAGVLNAPGFVTGQIGRAATDIGFQRLGAEVTLDEAIRGGKQGALGFETDINKFLAGTSPEAIVGGSTMRARTPTFGEQVGPALSGFGGQLAGYGFGSYLQQQNLQGIKDIFAPANVKPSIGPGYFGMYGDQFPGSVPGGPR